MVSCFVCGVVWCGQTSLLDAEAKKQYMAIKTRKLRFVTFILNKDKPSEIVCEKIGDKKCNWTQYVPYTDLPPTQSDPPPN